MQICKLFYLSHPCVSFRPLLWSYSWQHR